MPRKILVTGGSAVAVDLVEVEADNELELQEILRANPQLVPTEDPRARAGERAAEEAWRLNVGHI